MKTFASAKEKEGWATSKWVSMKFYVHRGGRRHACRPVLARQKGRTWESGFELNLSKHMSEVLKCGKLAKAVNDSRIEVKK